MGTYTELVKRPNSRFRELMAEQLAAADATDLNPARSSAKIVDEPDVAVEREEGEESDELEVDEQQHERKERA